MGVGSKWLPGGVPREGGICRIGGPRGANPAPGGGFVSLCVFNPKIKSKNIRTPEKK